MSAVEAVPAKLTAAERLEVLEDAIARERVGGSWRVQHVMAVVDVSKASVYRTPWLMRIRKRRGTRGVSWVPKDVREGMERASKVKRSPTRRAD